MMPTIWKRAVVLWAFVLAACTVQLVPSYDQALVEGLDEANTAALTLFAGLEGGSPQSEFNEYQGRYAEVIGQFDALRQRALTRQIPPLARRISSMRAIAAFCNAADNPTSCLNASPASLQSAIDLLGQMRDRHRSASGLAADLVPTFRDSYYAAITPALTVENALKR
jgi:hypothetical protein